MSATGSTNNLFASWAAAFGVSSQSSSVSSDEGDEDLEGRSAPDEDAGAWSDDGHVGRDWRSEGDAVEEDFELQEEQEEEEIPIQKPKAKKRRT
jgi:hypothetical protein